MPDAEVEELRRWAQGNFYPLKRVQGRDGLDELADKMSARPNQWWDAFQSVFAESDKPAMGNLTMPFAALLHAGGQPLRAVVAAAARGDRKTANAFWNATDFLDLSKEAYERVGRPTMLDAFVRLAPRIPSRPGQARAEEWEDEWSGNTLSFLTRDDPDEAWAVCLELLALSGDAEWIATIGVFIVEDLLRDNGDAFIDRIEVEATRNDRLRMALPSTRFAVPDHLVARVKTAAGSYWKETPLSPPPNP